MSTPGPKPMPTHLRVVRGTRPDRINKKEPKPRAAKPKCPTWLSDEAKAVWRRTVKELEAMNILASADQDIIVAYANAVVNFQRATELVDRSGVLVKGRRDGVVTNPAVRVQRDAAQLIRQLASELGLTPSSRTRLSAEKADGGADDFLD
jgi:P27 family predicted phage terminase small subunit